MKKVMAVLLVTCLAGVVSAAPALDGDWAPDVIHNAWTDSEGSPYTLVLDTCAVFRITDAFLEGDTFKVWDHGNLILTTSFMAGDPTTNGTSFGESAWQDIRFSSGEVLLDPGLHVLTIQGDGVAGLPAGFYTQLETAACVPAPGALMLGSIGLGCFNWIRRRKSV